MKTFRPMLSADLNKANNDFASVRYPVLASPKLDGIRAVIRDGKLLTRSLKPVPNRFVRAYLEGHELEGLDGELLVAGEKGVGSFQAVTSAIMRREGEPNFTFNVFDWASNAAAPFQARLKKAELVLPENDPRVRLVAHCKIASPSDLEDYERLCLDEGWEGCMIRDPEGPYKFGRSTLREGWLIKVKRFVDAEFRVVGYEERQRNNNEAYRDELGRQKRSTAQAGKVGVDMLGALLVEGLPGGAFAGKRFSVGSGLNDGLRATWWHRRDELEGMIVKIKWQPAGVKDLPRSPIFLGFRSKEDL